MLKPNAIPCFFVMKYSNLLQAIGHTPLVQLQNLITNKNVKLFAKLEGQNPGGSVKDRAAAYMIEQAEKRGELKPGKIILEATSGNMGIALSMVGAHKGYEVQIVMSEGMSLERRNMMKAFGAKLILTDKSVGTMGAIEKARSLVAESPDLYWFSNQFNNPDNTLAHYYGLAPEILSDLPDIDYLILGVATAGTAMGIIKRFKEDSPKTTIIPIFPPGGYKIQGIQNPREDFKGDLLDESIIGHSLQVSNEDAYETSRRAAREEGLLVGMSSGAVLFGALKTAETLESSTIVVVLADRGEKYLSTELFS